MLHYIDLKYRPKDKDLIANFYVEPNNISLEKAAENVALESSIGTWTAISTMNEKIAKTLKPHVFSINKKSKVIKIAYPQGLFEPGNMPQILSSIAGNIFGMKLVKNLRLLDISFPKKLRDSFLGPAFGIKGIRKITGVKKRPLVGTIVKPKVGLSAKQHANVAYESWVGGLDIVKDDENLSSMSFNSFEDRMKETFKARDLAETQTGEVKIYMPNITAETFEMIRRAKIIKKFGGRYMMIDILTTGFAGLQTLRKANLGLVIHAHRAGHAMVTRNKKHGMSMLAIAKISRLIGVDQLHIGTAVGKMEGDAVEVKTIEDVVEENFIKKNDSKSVLEQNWGKVKPVFAVASGGLHPGMSAEVVKIMGKDIIMQFGGGCHGHPDGTRSGASAIRQTVSAIMKNKSLVSYAKDHQELARAFSKWKPL